MMIQSCHSNTYAAKIAKPLTSVRIILLNAFLIGDHIKLVSLDAPEHL